MKPFFTALFSIFSFFYLFSQNSPKEQGGNHNKTIDFRNPPTTFHYDFEKFNPNYHTYQLKERKCAVVEVERQRRTFRGSEKTETFEDWIKRTMKEEEGLALRDIETPIIPVVVHVIYSNPSENISDEQIYSQIQVLNEDYQRKNKDTALTSARFSPLAANIGIAFKLATHNNFGEATSGINRISMAGAPFTEKYINEVIKPNTIWNTRKYLNIWICNIEKGVLGFSQFPESSGLKGIPSDIGTDNTDGVVINYQAFGTIGTVKPPFNKGRTATHEIGHWLGLRHIWGDGDCDASDFCEDTPQTDGPNFGCNYGKKGCTETAMIENFMDYTNDSCMNAFTHDQNERITAVMLNSPRRKELIISDAAKPLPKPPVPALTADIRSGIKGLTVQYKLLTQEEHISYKWSFPGGEPVSSTERNPKVKYNKPGVFHAVLSTSNEFGSEIRTMPNYVTIYEKGEKLPVKIDFEKEISKMNPHESIVLLENGWQEANTLGAYGESSGALWVNNFSNNRLGLRSCFFLPLMDFSSGVQAQLTFDKAYKSYDIKYTDTLGIYISTDAGAHFHAIYHKFGTKLSPSFSNDLFSPLPSDWETETIDLREYDGEKNVMIAFVNFSGYGNNLFLDNIQVSSAPLPLPEIDFELSTSEICVGDSVLITDKTKYNPEKWHWSFPNADISADTLQNPYISYSQAGTFDITLTAINSSGENTQSKKAIIKVKAAPEIQVSGVPLSSICPNTPITLSASGAADLSWTYRDKHILSATFSDTLAYTTSFLVTGRGNNGCIGKKVVVIEGKDEKEVILRPPFATLCQGDTLELSVSGGASYNWLNPANLIHNQGNTIQIKPSENTTYKVLTTSKNGCSVMKRMEVKVNPRPHFQVTADKNVICQGEKVQLVASGANTYIWENGEKGKSIGYAPNRTTMLKTVALNEFGCDDSIYTQITVNQKPIVSLSPANPTICEGQTLTLKAIGNVSYKWIDVDEKTVLSTQNTLTVVPTASSNYSLLLNSDKGCKDTLIVPVVVHPLQSPDIVSDIYAVCKGESVNLQAQGGKQYEWKAEDGNTWTGERITVFPDKNAYYTLSAKDSNNCATKKASIHLKTLEDKRPKADFELRNIGKICAGETVYFVDASKYVKSYYWEFPGAKVSKSTQPNPEVVYEQGGWYSVYLFVAGCSETDSMIKTDFIFVEDAPKVTIDAEKTEVCEGEEISLDANAKGAISYTWSPAVGLNKTTGTEVLANPKSTTSYTVTVKNKEGCIAKDKITLNVLKSKETLTIQPSSPSVCAGDTLMLSAETGFDHEWQLANMSKIWVGKFVALAPKTSTILNVSGKNSLGCPITTQIPLTVYPKHTVSVSPQNIVLCKNGTATLEAKGSGSYRWSPEIGLNDFSGNVVSASPKQSTTYTVEGTDENGCVSSAQTNVQVSPTASVHLAVENTHICKGNATQIEASGGGNYEWSPNYGIAENQGAYITVSPEQTTTYIVKSRSEDGCVSQANATIYIHQLPGIPILPKSATICAGDSILLRAETTYPLRWGEGVKAAFASRKEVYVSPDQSMVYTVNAWDEMGCLRTGITTVQVNKNETARISAPQTAVCEGNTITLEASGGNEFQWIGPNGRVSVGARLVVSPEKNEVYKVVIKDQKGCKDTASYAINARMFVPQISVSQWEIDLANEKGLVHFEDKTIDAKEWLWDFGDGGSSNAKSPKHVYTQPGTYIAKLTVSNGLCSQTIEKKMRIDDSSEVMELEKNGSLLTDVSPKGMLKIRFNLPTDMTFKATIINAKQEELISGFIHAKQGLNEHNMDLGDLPRGTYTLELSDKNNKISKKVSW